MHDSNLKVKIYSVQNYNSLAVITEDHQICVFDTTGNNDETIVKITGAGGNGFVPKCTVLKQLKTFVLQEVTDKELYNWCWFAPNAAMASHGQFVYVFLCTVLSCCVGAEEYYTPRFDPRRKDQWQYTLDI